MTKDTKQAQEQQHSHINARRNNVSEDAQTRQQQFAQLSDDDQEAALRLVKLYRYTDPGRRLIIDDLLRGGEVSSEAKDYLVALLRPDFFGVVNQALDELSQLDLARSRARTEADTLAYDWKRRRSRREHQDLYRDDLDYYSDILAKEHHQTPNIAAYVALLRKRFRVEG